MHYSYVLAALAATASARDVPSNVQALLDSITQQGECKNKLQDGFYSIQGDDRSSSYCGDHLEDYGIVYLQGTNGNLVNMDTDCDGTKYGKGYDGRCSYEDDFQPETSFKDQLHEYSSQEDLNTFVHTYIVLGNVGSNEDGSSSKPDYTVFDPRTVGVEPLSLAVVVCNGAMHLGIVGDQNGDDGDPLVGEASISMATLCFGDGVSGSSGYDGNDVLYIAFTGADAVPRDEANWDADTKEEFEDSLVDFANGLLSKIGGGNGGTTPTPTTTAPAGPTSTTSAGPTSTAPSQDCAWPGHCQGTSCSSDDDCSDPWACVSGTCN